VTIKHSITAGLTALGVSAAACANVSGNLTITSDYVSRGVSQTNNQPAVQAGLDLVSDEGLYVGTWISNTSNGAEVDLYAGLTGMLESVNYDLGILGYIYPSRDNENYTELYANFSFHALSAGVAYTVGSKVDDTDQGNENNIEGDLYYFVSANIPLDTDWDLSGTLGYYDFSDDGVANKDTSYQHMEVSLSKSVDDLGMLTLAISKASRESGDNDPLLSVAWSQNF